MKISALLALSAAVLAGPATAAVNVGVSIGINAPGQYGRIDIDNYPRPAVVVQQPVLVAPSPVAVYQRPIYLYVPAVHQRQWGQYCGRYRACGQPVYFVQETWVREQYQSERGQRSGHPGRGHGKHKDKHHDKHNGKGHGKGHQG